MSWDVLISIVGCLGGWELVRYLLNWRSEKLKNKNEAEKAGYEADTIKVDAWKSMQDVYQQTINDQKSIYDELKKYTDELQSDRQNLRKERDEIRDFNNELRRRLKDMDDKIRELEGSVARYGRMVEALRPFVCYVPNCKNRTRVAVNVDNVEVKKDSSAS